MEARDGEFYGGFARHPFETRMQRRGCIHDGACAAAVRTFAQLPCPLVSYNLHRSRIERASQQLAVRQFQLFADIEALVTSIRAERGMTTSVVLLGEASIPE